MLHAGTSWHPQNRMCRPADELSCQESRKRDIGAEVAPKHPTRLLIEPIEPLQPRILHPGGSATDRARENVERAAYPHNEWNAKFVLVLSQQSFLAGRRQTQEQTIRTRTTN